MSVEVDVYFLDLLLFPTWFSCSSFVLFASDAAVLDFVPFFSFLDVLSMQINFRRTEISRPESSAARLCTSRRIDPAFSSYLVNRGIFSIPR